MGNICEIFHILAQIEENGRPFVEFAWFAGGVIVAGVGVLAWLSGLGKQ